ncbi:MAG: DUF1501 domain-containing protein [Planctomycetaceae bacterium]
MNDPSNPARRRLLQTTACGFGSLALAGLCAEARADDAGRRDPLAPKLTHHPPRAKRVIFIFMQGGPSQVDTFDPKERLTQDDGQVLEFYNARNRRVQKQRLQKSPWGFQRYGESGRWVSDLFPEQAQHVDDFCLIRSMHTEGVAHGPATLFLHTGATNLIRPSVGAWVTYGLGTENRNLPGFITINPTAAKGGPRNYANAFLPTHYQGTVIGRAGQSLKLAKIRHITNSQLPRDVQKKQFDLLQALNREQSKRADDDERLQAVIDSFELAYRMQNHAPGTMDISGETRQTRRMYGIGEKETDDFGRQCLLARRFAEQGVRYIQISYSDNAATPKWDQHSNLKKHAVHAKATDKPVAGLLADLKQRGLLDDTLVWWGGEFGRTPFAQGKDGRDHNPRGFCVWLAGGGVKPGHVHGETDEFGYEAVKDKVHMHDLHATILHLLGMNHERLTYRYAGRDFRLTDVAGRVVRGILA